VTNAPASAKTRTPYDDFETDAELEVKGIKVDYDDYWFHLARAGGANEAFAQRLNELTQPYKRAIETDSMSAKLSAKLTRQAFTDTVLLGWGSKLHGEGKMLARDKSAIPFTKEAAMAYFEELPDLMRDLLTTAQKGHLYRKELASADAKNSGSSSATS